MVKEILFATSNQGKARELKEAFKQADVDVIIKTNADLENPPHPIESGHTFEANAKIKAHELADFSKMPTIADDSGLMVDALNGEPGVRSARYAGEAHNDAKNNAKLATSCGKPILFIGILLIIVSFSLNFSVISVFINPGAIALQQTFLEANSLATDLVRPIIPDFEAE